MKLKDALDFIHAPAGKRSDLALDRVSVLMDRLSQPQRDLKFVHVAGTNGKGSACAMLSSILTCAGYRTGLYTSPHLERVHERFRINGAEISDEGLIRLAEQVSAAAAGMEDPPTEFERLTAMALLYFKQERCDIVVLEVGLGGRLDATNMIPCPEVAVLMNIGLEHTEILGHTLARIAGEKAGIIKAGGTVVAYPGPQETVEVFQTICAERCASLHMTSLESLQVTSEDLRGQTFSWGPFQNIRLNLLGPHQVKNAAVVLNVISQLQMKGWNIPPQTIRKGLDCVVWPARMEILSRNPFVLLDGAHNPQCVDAMANALKRLMPDQKFVFLVGVLADKDYAAMLSLTYPLAVRYLCVTPDSERALPAGELADYLRGHGHRADAYDSIDSAIKVVLELQGAEKVVTFGSLYLAGSVRNCFYRCICRQQRTDGIRSRDQLSPAERAERSHKIVQKILDSEHFKAASCVMSYRAVKGEVDLTELNDMAKRMNKRVVFPLCISESEMEAMLPLTEDSWTLGHYGIPEPVPELSQQVAPENIDLIICPCSAFDPECHRMGMGAGYYDRYLERCKYARVIAVAFEAQKLGKVHHRPWDKIMEQVYTEKAIYGQDKTDTRKDG